jgi:thiol-disulfide isomerase/thioredoxin
MWERRFRPAIAAATLIVMCGGCREGVALVGHEMALDLAPITADAVPVSTADLKGKITLINFWATWCGPCIAEFPHLLRIADGFRDQKDFRFLSVATGHPTLDEIRTETTTFLKAHGYRFPVYADVQKRTQGMLSGATNVIPVTVLVDRSGKIAKVIVGYNSAELDRMQLEIASLLTAAK